MKYLNFSFEEFFDVFDKEYFIKKYIENFKFNTDLENFFFEQFIFEELNNIKNIEPFSPEFEELKEKHKKTFNQWLKYELSFKIDGISKDLKKLINNNGDLLLYRGMNIYSFENFKDKILNYKQKDLGICWTYDKQCISDFAYKVEGKDKIELIAYVNEREIDWVTTIEVQLCPTIGEEEKEIRLFSNSLIKLKQMTINEEVFDISSNDFFIGGDKGLADGIEHILNNRDLLEAYIKDNKFENIEDFKICLKQYHKKTKTVLNKIKPIKDSKIKHKKMFI